MPSKREDERMEEEEEEEDQPDDGEIQVDFDVNSMHDVDKEGTETLLELSHLQPLPGDEAAYSDSLDCLSAMLLQGAFTSVAKQNFGGTDSTDVLCVCSILDWTGSADQSFIKYMGRHIDTIVEGKAPGQNYLNKLGEKGTQVGLVVSDRMEWLPLQINVHMVENAWTEYGEALKTGGAPDHEYFLIIARFNSVRMDEEDEPMAQPQAPASGKGRKRARGEDAAPPAKRTRTKLDPKELTEGDLTEGHFVHPEEWAFWENRDRSMPFTYGVMKVVHPDPVEGGSEADAPKGAVTSGEYPPGGVQPAPEPELIVFWTPILVHKSKMESVITGLKSLDAYFANQAMMGEE